MISKIIVDNNEEVFTIWDFVKINRDILPGPIRQTVWPHGFWFRSFSCKLTGMAQTYSIPYPTNFLLQSGFSTNHGLMTFEYQHHGLFPKALGQHNTSFFHQYLTYYPHLFFNRLVDGAWQLGPVTCRDSFAYQLDHLLWQSRLASIKALLHLPCCMQNPQFVGCRQL